MYYAGIDPFTKKPVAVAKNMRDRKLPRALMQFFKPANWFAVAAITGTQDWPAACSGWPTSAARMT